VARRAAAWANGRADGGDAGAATRQGASVHECAGLHVRVIRQNESFYCVVWAWLSHLRFESSERGERKLHADITAQLQTMTVLACTPARVDGSLLLAHVFL